MQDTILSSFFWGYMLLQIPAGQLAHRFGAKYLIVTTMAVNALVSVCLPWAAIYVSMWDLKCISPVGCNRPSTPTSPQGGWVSTVCLRVLQGLSQASLFPSTHTFFGRWAPLQERGRLTALVYGGKICSHYYYSYNSLLFSTGIWY